MRTFNTLDVWVEDPEVPERRYIVHYLIDFGKALGAFVNLGPRYEDGHAHVADPHVFRSLLTLGLWKRPWEYARDPDITGVGTFDVQSYRPGDFATQRLYWPFVVADEYDRLWAARIMLRFTEAHIRAALEAGQHVDPRAVEYLTAVLIGRQRKGARYWLRRVNPLVDPTLSADGQTLCVTDLLVAHGLERRAVNGSRYRARAYDYAGRELGSSQTLEHRDGTICASGFGRGRLEQGYTIVRFDTLRPGRRHRPVEIHLAEAAGGQRRVIGVNRR